MSWYKDNVNVKDDMTGRLRYSFIPEREDHNKSVACVVRIVELAKPLRKVVTLNIECNLIFSDLQFWHLFYLLCLNVLF